MDREPMRSILAVEDNDDAQLLLRYLLRESFALTVVPTIDDALDAATRHEFDLLLLDINMGEDRTGVDLLHAVRSLPMHEETPAVAFTAYALPGDDEHFLNMGFNSYLSKPFTREQLYDVIRGTLQACKISPV